MINKSVELRGRKGEEAWKEVVYSARVSGVPSKVKD